MAAVALPLAPAPTRTDSASPVPQGYTLPEHLRRSFQGELQPQGPASGAYGQPEELQGAPNFRQYEPNVSDPRRTSAAPVPIPAATAMNERSASGSSASGKPLGPASKEFTVPSRPKPGRKPLAQEDQQDRRRVQNRLAQRHFRDKRAQKVSELTQDNETLRREMDAMMGEHNRQLAQRNERMQQMQQEIDSLKQRLDRATKRAHAHEVANGLNAGFTNTAIAASNPSAPHMATSYPAPTNGMDTGEQSLVTPPDDELATDMSSAWQRSNVQRPQSSGDDDNQWINGGMDYQSHEKCGFCEGHPNCPCEQARKAQASLAPGTCDKCQQDPEQAARCRMLAEQASVPQDVSAARNDSTAGLPSTMSCSSFIDQVGQRMPSIAELFAGPLHAYPATNGSGGYDINEQEAAQVLQSLSSRDAMEEA